MPAQSGAVTEEELSAMKARYERATPGPWTFISESRDHIVGSDFIMTGGEDIYLTGATTADQDFIAHARDDIPRLVEEVERLRKLLTGTGAQ